MTSTQIILLASVAAALLVGWFARGIKASQQLQDARDQMRSALEQATAQAEQALAEQNRLTDELRVTRTGLANQERQSKDFRDQARTLTGSLKSSELRVSELEAQVQASEEQFMRVQRELARQKLYKSHEIQQLQQQLRDSAPGEGVLQQPDPPVLRPSSISTTRTATATEGQTVGSSVDRPSSDRAAGAAISASLPDITDEDLDTDEDVFEMTSEFDFDPEELLADVDPE